MCFAINLADPVYSDDTFSSFKSAKNLCIQRALLYLLPLFISVS